MIYSNLTAEVKSFFINDYSEKAAELRARAANPRSRKAAEHTASAKALESIVSKLKEA